MDKVIIYSVAAGMSLFLGMLFALKLKIKQKVIAAIMAFGSGTLICALTFGLMEEAFQHGGFDAVIIGFIAGGIVFVLFDYIIHWYGGRKHKRCQHLAPEKEPTGRMITVGSILDNIPESVALGITLVNPSGIGFLMASSIVLSNLPESISSTQGLKKEGHSNLKIFFIWLIVALSVVVISMLSHIFLDEISRNNLGIIEAFAAGAILAMLADTMIPEAYEEGGFLIGLITVGGFLTAFILAKI